MPAACPETGQAAVLCGRLDRIHLTVNGTRLRVTVQGEGLPLVLLHGGPGTLDYTAPLADLLTTGHRVLRFNQRGCGASSHTPPYTVEALLTDLEALREHFGFERWLVMGHSWGADMALAYTLTSPERTTALLHLAGTGIQNDRDWKAAYERGLAAGLEPPGDFGPVNEQAKRAYLASWRAWIKAPNLLRRLAECRVPALFVSGEHDIRPHWPVAQLAALLPQARWEVLRGVGHQLWERPVEVQRLMLDFLDTVRNQGCEPDGAASSTAPTP